MWDGAESALYVALESDPSSNYGSAFVCVTLGTRLNFSETLLLIGQERLPVLMFQD